MFSIIKSVWEHLQRSMVHIWTWIRGRIRQTHWMLRIISQKHFFYILFIYSVLVCHRRTWTSQKNGSSGHDIDTWIPTFRSKTLQNVNVTLWTHETRLKSLSSVTDKTVRWLRLNSSAPVQDSKQNSAVGTPNAF